MQIRTQRTKTVEQISEFGVIAALGVLDMVIPDARINAYTIGTSVRRRVGMPPCQTAEHLSDMNYVVTYFSDLFASNPSTTARWARERDFPVLFRI